MESYEVLIVGGGPAGLSAALVLGRCRRKICVVDAGRGRNERAQAAHGIFTREGASPEDLRRMGRAQLEPYDVTVHDDEVVAVTVAPAGFEARTRAGRVVACRKLLLATGMRDHVPERPGFDALFGRGVYVCPYCDGWENRDRRLAAYGPAAEASELALALLTWSADVVLVTAGERLDGEARARLERNGVVVHEDDVDELESEEGRLRALVLASGARVARDALFIKLGEVQTAPFAAELGCELTESQTVRTGSGERSGPPGVFVAGDASHDLQLVSVAVAEGVKAACAINTELRKESLR